jgi:hypothetical protein
MYSHATLAAKYQANALDLEAVESELGLIRVRLKHHGHSNSAAAGNPTASSPLGPEPAKFPAEKFPSDARNASYLQNEAAAHARPERC